MEIFSPNMLINGLQLPHPSKVHLDASMILYSLDCSSLMALKVSFLFRGGLCINCHGTESSLIDESSWICHTLPKYSYADGDGTVPSESAMADNFDAVERVGVSASHRGLLKDKKVFELLQNWLQVPEKSKIQHVVRKTSRVVDACSMSHI